MGAGGGVTHRLLQTDSQIDHGHVGGGDTEGHACQLAVEGPDMQDVRSQWALLTNKTSHTRNCGRKVQMITIQM